jgi:hypothetical protein
VTCGNHAVVAEVGRMASATMGGVLAQLHYGKAVFLFLRNKFAKWVGNYMYLEEKEEEEEEEEEEEDDEEAAPAA